MKTITELLKKRGVQVALALFIGITIGALFYPSTTTTERVKKEITEKYELQIKELKEVHASSIKEVEDTLEHREEMNRELREETSRKVASLTTENRQLRQSSKRKKFKLVKPDGTIIEKEYEESQSEEISSVVTEVREEFNRKVSSIENKWKSIHISRVESLKEDFNSKIEKIKSEKKEKIVYVEKEKIVEVNKKKLRPEIGVTSEKEAYIHGTYTLWGPVFVGTGASMDIETKAFGDARFGLGIEL